MTTGGISTAVSQSNGVFFTNAYDTTQLHLERLGLFGCRRPHHDQTEPIPHRFQPSVRRHHRRGARGLGELRHFVRPRRGCQPPLGRIAGLVRGDKHDLRFPVDDPWRRLRHAVYDRRLLRAQDPRILRVSTAPARRSAKSTSSWRTTPRLTPPRRHLDAREPQLARGGAKSHLRLRVVRCR